MPAPRRPNRIQTGLESFRLALARPDALVQLSLLGAICGLFSGLVIIALRLSIELSTSVWGLSDAESFEQLPALQRVLIATLGGLFIGLVFQWVGDKRRQVGVVHVLERLAYHQSRLPIGNALLQFVGATISLACGHSMGREGPAIHLGAASGSWLGRSLGLPNNSNRLLVGAGCAGAIAAAFNTPLAGVVFALEVILMEYGLMSFIPIIVAAVSATAASRAVFGDAPAFEIPPLEAGHLSELPFVIGLGLLAGLAAVVFIELIQRIERIGRDLNHTIKFGAAGAICGLIAIPIPEVMGVGYDTVNLTLLGQISAGALVMLALAKISATAICVGLGLPGGLIAPTLVIGAAIGGATGILGATLIPSHASSAGYYAILGMGATMAAALQAPLAALVAILELTYNPAVVLSGMLAIVSASLLARKGFGKQSVFLLLLRARGLDYRHNALETALAGIGVTSVADRSFVRSERKIDFQTATELIERRPRWIIIELQATAPLLMPAAELANHLNHARESGTESEPIDLLSIPGRRLETVDIDTKASLLEAHHLLQDSAREVLLVCNAGSYRAAGCFGILSRSMLIEAYLPQRRSGA